MLVIGMILLVRAEKQQVWLHGTLCAAAKAVLQNAGMFLLIACRYRPCSIIYMEERPKGRPAYMHTEYLADAQYPQSIDDKFTPASRPDWISSALPII